MSQTKLFLSHHSARTWAVALGAALGVSAQAQISVGPGGSGVQTFNTAPPTTQWSGGNRLPSLGTAFPSGAALDAAVQTNSAASINTALANNAGATPGTTGVPAWSSTLQSLYTRPTGNSYSLLMGQFVNNIGDAASAITIHYDMATFNAATAELPGWHIYYSLTGNANDWTLIPEISDAVVSGPVTATVNLPTHWALGSTLYLLWADDNGDGVSDESYTLDNFVLSATPANISPVALTTQPPAAFSLDERSSTNLAFVATGAPQFIQWYRDGNLIPGATSSQLPVGPAAYPGDNGAVFHAVITNSISAVTTAVSVLSVNPDTFPPQLLSAVGHADLTKVTLSFSEDLFPTAVNGVDPANFTLYPLGTDPDAGGPTLTILDAALANGSNVVLTTDARTAGLNYVVRAQDLLDNSSQQNILSPSPTNLVIRQTVEMVGFDSDNEWKYDLNNGDRFGTGWEMPGFDDSTWPSGPAGLGLDASANGVPIRTQIAYAANSVPVFFRRHFSLPSSTNGVRLFLRDVVEDGAVYYINGQEVFRHNVAPGALTANSRAAGTQTDPTPIQGPFELPVTGLQPGDNVIAVAVLQSGNASTDIEMAAELHAEIPSFLTGPPSIVTQPVAFQQVNEGHAATFMAAVEGALPLYFQWSKGANPLTGANASTFTIPTVVPGDAGIYRVTVTNEFGAVTSGNAELVVVPDTTAPSLLTVHAETNLTTITITFSERLDALGAQNPGNFSVQLAAGGGALTVDSATLVNGTNVVLVTSPRTQGQDYVLTVGGVTDTAAARNPVTPASHVVTSFMVLLAPDDVTNWRFDASSNILDGVAWQAPAFDDSAWLTGLAGFTSSNALEITTNGFELRTTNMLSTSVGGPPTAYYRVRFQFPASTVGASLSLIGVVDDGLVAYVNGVEAGRLRMTNASPVSFTNLATAASPETSDTHLPLEVITLTNLAGLVTGENVLAIELHQNSLTSSDAVLAVQLVAGIDSFAAVTSRPTLRTSRNLQTGQITITWENGTLQQTDSLLPGGAGFADVPGNPSSPFTVNATGSKYYRVRQ